MDGEFWTKNGIKVMYGLFAAFFAGFVTVLVLYILELDKNKRDVDTYTGTSSSGVTMFFQLDHNRNQFGTFSASFQTIGVADIDVSGDFKTTLQGPPSMDIEWQSTGGANNTAVVVLNANLATRDSISLTRLTLQSLLPVFNKLQSTEPIPTLFNNFY